MTIYRALDKLNIGVRRGGIFRSNRISSEAAKILLRRGRIALVHAPPVREVQSLKPVAEKLEAAGIESVADIVDADKIEGVEEQELDNLKSDAVEALTADDEDCHGCGS